MGFLIVTDSSAGFNAEEIKNISNYASVLPLSIIADGNAYEDTSDDLPADLFIKVMEEKTVTTSQVPLILFKNAFAANLKKTDEILCLTLSSKLSGCYEQAKLAAKQLGAEDKITVYDTQAIGGVLKKMVTTAIQAAKNGKSVADIITNLDHIKSNYKCLFVVGDISQLERSGRITRTVAAFAKVLNIVPVLEFKDGAITKCFKTRTVKKAVKNVLEDFKNDNRQMTDFYGYTLKIQPDLATKIKAIVQKANVLEVKWEKVPRLIAAHTGTATYGFIAFFD